MRYLDNREEFIKVWKDNNVKIYEKFDMSGGSGPMGNDINWGDSLVGRLFNSVFRKIGVGKDLLSIDNVIKQIQKEFDTLNDAAKLKSSNVDETEISKIHISFLLEALTKAVHSGSKIYILVAITEETIDIVEKSKLSDEDKESAIKELEDFLDFLNKYEDVNIGEDLSEELTGINKELEEKMSTSTSGWGDKIYSGMKIMLDRLNGIIENKDEFITTEQGKEEDSIKEKNINYVYNKIISEINKGKDKDSEFKNNLLTKSKDINWPLIEISGNQIIYRKSKKLAEIKDDKLMVSIPKYDETNKKWTGDEKPRLVEFSNKNITNIASYIASKLSDIQSIINSDKKLVLNEKEVEWFNKAISGLWLVIKSKSGNNYKTKIGECKADGTVGFLSKPVEQQSNTSINSILTRGKIFKTEEEANVYFNEKWKSGESNLSKKGKSHNIEDGKRVSNEDKPEKIKDTSDTTENVPDNTRVNLQENSSLDNSSEDYFLIFEKNTLSKQEEYANQALSRLKTALDLLINGENIKGGKSPKVDSVFLNSISKSGSKDFMKKFAEEIKNKYDQVSDGIQNKPLYTIGSEKTNENIESIDDTLVSSPREKLKAKGERDKSAEKIASFAAVSMLFIGEDLYSSLGKIGEQLNLFNNEFQKLLNTEFKVEESINKSIFRYNDFLKINENKAEEIAEEIKNYYDNNVSYDKWVIRKEDVEEIDNQIENAKIEKIPHENIIQIVKLFNKAYKIHTTDVIPSGRKGGKVSNRVFNEYQYMGGKAGSGPSQAEDGGIKPGIGPYRNKKVFNKFESAVLDIIRDSKYKDLFSEEVIVSTDEKTGEKKTAPGNGKILMKFITELLDGKDLYNSGAQSKFMQEYFGFKIDDSKLNNVPLVNRDNKANKATKKGKWVVVNEVSLKYMRRFYLITDNKGNRRIFFVAENDGVVTYIKSSKGSKHFAEVWKNEIDIEARKDDKQILFLKTNEKEIKTGTKLSFDYYNLNDRKNGSGSIEIGKIEVLKFEDDDKPFTLSTSTKSHSDIEPDKLNLNELKNKL